MHPVSSRADASLFDPEAHPVLGLGIRRLRAAFAEESVDPGALWYLASEGLALWVRFVERALGDHLDDRYRARAIVTEASREMLLRRASALPPPLSRELSGADPADVRAFFEALYPGPIARSIRWSLGGIAQAPRSVGARTRALRRVLEMGARARWIEVSHHLGELAIVLTERLPERRVPRAVGWLGDVCYAFGREVGELSASVFSMPATTESAIETLRMGELLFRVNPEHRSGSDEAEKTGFIEGNACLWYQRPGWGNVHCGVFGRFQEGIADVFGLRYSLTQTIPKHGGSVCRITLTSISKKGAADRPRPSQAGSTWQPPTRLVGDRERGSMMAALAQGREPADGFFGPDSLLWVGTRETALLLGGGRAALMQLAHPAVAHAIRDHSAVHRDMLGRFLRTMTSSYGILFGSIDEALGISNQVRRMHSSISGVLDDVPGQDLGRYSALDGEATFWVGATLFDTAMLVYEQMVQPLPTDQRDRLVREAGPFWALFGVPLSACPTTWADLRGYVERRVESLAPLVGDTARRQAGLLFEPRSPFLRPIFDQGRLIVAEMMPEPLRRAFGMEMSAPERLLARTWIFAAERMLPRLPARLRYVPAYHRAVSRVRRAAR